MGEGWNQLALEVYRDLLQPVSREVGHDLCTVYKNRLQRFRKRLLGKVPEDRRQKAHPQIAGPTLEGLKYVDEDGIIAEMFLNLLARAIDKERVGEAHPAFSEIIKHLSPDEAIFLFNLKQKPMKCTWHSSTAFPFGKKYLQRKLENGELVREENFSVYVDHLDHLNLIRSTIKDPQSASRPSEVRKGRIVYLVSGVILLSEFGKLFASACVPDKLPPFS